MAYAKTVYVNDSAPAISADNLNKSENELEFLDNSTTDLKAYKTDNVYGGATTDYAQTVTTGKAWNATYGEPSDNNARAIVGPVRLTPDMKSLTIASGYTMIVYGNNAGQGSALSTIRNYSSAELDLTSITYAYILLTIARNDHGDITSDNMTNKVKISKYNNPISFAKQPDLDSTNNEIARIDNPKTYTSKNLLNPNKFTTVGQYYTNDSGAVGGHSTSESYISYDDLIPVTPSTDYVLSRDGSSLTTVSLLMIDSTGTHYLDGGYNHTGDFTTTASTYYIRISISKQNYDAGKVMLAKESTPSPYVPWFAPYTVGIREEVDYLLEESVPSSGNIVCWGDSLTYGSGSTAGNTYPEKLAALTGKTVYSCGFPGDTSLEIAGMQGAIPMLVAPVTIPASGSVNVTIYDAEKSADYPFRFPSIDAAAGVNPVEIGGIKGNLDLSAGSNVDNRIFAFTRSEEGDAKVLTWYEPLITTCSKERNTDIQVIFIGTNGGWNSNNDTLIKQIACMVENQGMGIKKYLVVGLTTGTTSTRNDLESKMINTFGRHFVNARAYLSAQAIYDEGVTPTEQDTTDMSEGKVPTSLRSDATHLNDKGYDALANIIYKAGKVLNYWT